MTAEPFKVVPPLSEELSEVVIDRRRRDGDDNYPEWAERRTKTRQPPLVETVSLIIPAKNEARNLATVLEHVPDVVSEVILVDGRSNDVTRSMAKLCNSEVRIVQPAAKGKGNALRSGFDAARGDLIIAIDADGSMMPTEIPNMLYFLRHGYDFVKGSRFMLGGGSLDITPLRGLGNKVLCGMANQMFESKMTDLCYGYFGFRRQFLANLDLRSTGFEIETEITARALLIGLRMTEVPSMELPRRHGNSNLRTFRDGFRVLRTLYRERARASRDGEDGPSSSTTTVAYSEEESLRAAL
jgi:glycosyltransferase involved in cell wall biosynthesis